MKSLSFLPWRLQGSVKVAFWKLGGGVSEIAKMLRSESRKLMRTSERETERERKREDF